MKRNVCFLIGLFCIIFFVGQAQGHFGMVIPSDNIIKQDNKEITLDLLFSHPFEMRTMELEKPDKFYVIKKNIKQDLLAGLSETKLLGHTAWSTKFKFKQPGVYQFVMEPAPYWEPVEELSIIHYTKTVISAFGDDEGWNEPVGLPTEIIPMLRPFGNYAGNTFVGKVMVQGKPVAGAEIEVEMYNENYTYVSPTEHHITQVVTSDENGVFSFTCPKAGWWGFAALSEADYTLKDPSGSEKGVELGAVLWIYLDEYTTK